MWTVAKVDPRDFGDRGPVFWVLIDPNGNATDAFPTRREAKAAAKYENDRV